MFNKIRNCRIHLVLMLVLLGSVPIVTPVFAAGITVNTVTDEDGTGANCSLREAITAANTDAAYGGCLAGSGSDTITLSAGIYTLTQGSQLPTVSTTIIINGNSATVQADTTAGTATYRVFEVIGGGGNLTIKDLTVRNGNCANAFSCDSVDDSGNKRGYGGGILNSGTLTVNNSFITANSAAGSGGGIYSWGGTLNVINGSTFFSNSATSGDGGGIGGDGAITLTNMIFSTNSALNGGGISTSGGSLNVTGSLFSTNSATGGSGTGGGIVSSGTLNVKTSSFHDNSAARGGGIFNGGGTNSYVSNSTFYLVESLNHVPVAL